MLDALMLVFPLELKQNSLLDVSDGIGALLKTAKATGQNGKKKRLSDDALDNREGQVSWNKKGQYIESWSDHAIWSFSGPTQRGGKKRKS